MKTTKRGYLIVGEYPSKSSSDIVHTVAADPMTLKVISCSCKGWTYNRKCWHFDAEVEKAIARAEQSLKEWRREQKVKRGLKDRHPKKKRRKSCSAPVVQAKSRGGKTTPKVSRSRGSVKPVARKSSRSTGRKSSPATRKKT